RRERPRGRRAADKRDELAPFQTIELHSIPPARSRIIGYRIGDKQSGVSERPHNLVAAPSAPSGRGQCRSIRTKGCLPTAHTRTGVSYRTSLRPLRLLVVPAQGGKGAYPRQRRAEPALPAWDEITALAQDPHPHHVGRLLPLPRRGRKDRRAAARTERLQAWIAALGRGLEVCRRLARYAKSCTGNGNIDAEGGAGADLAIRAVANRGLLRVRFTLDPDVSAVARAVDFHEFVPFPRPGSANASSA